ncbi:hypothetical protein D9M71_556500 [compost metagenome]
MPSCQQAIEDQLQCFPVLVGFPLGQHHGQYRVGSEGLAQAFEIQRRDGLVGNDGYLPTRNVRRQQLRLVQQAFANVDRVATLAQVDL